MSPRTKAQFQQIRDQSSQKILNAALELFGTKGYEATSISDIVAEAGVSKGLIYHYFDSKEDLLRQMIDNMGEEAEEVMEKILSEDPKESLRNIFKLFFDEMRTNYKRWQLIMNLTIQIEKFDFVRDMAEGKMKGYLQILEFLFIKMGWPRPDEEAKLLGALFDGIGVQYFVLKKEYHLEDMEKILIEKYCQ